MTRLKKKYRNYLKRLKAAGILKPRFYLGDKGEVTPQEYFSYFGTYLKNF